MYLKQNVANIQAYQDKNGEVGCGMNNGDQKVVCGYALNIFDSFLTCRL